MKHKALLFAFLPVLGAGLIVATSASAHGFMMGGALSADFAVNQQAMFDQEAKLLGLSVDDIKSAWAEGKTLQDIAKDKGLSDADLRSRIDATRKAAAQSRLQALVGKGVITQAQADARQTFETTRAANAKGGHGFFHRGSK
jgi:hypothetical protein